MASPSAVSVLSKPSMPASSRGEIDCVDVCDGDATCVGLAFSFGLVLGLELLGGLGLALGRGADVDGFDEMGAAVLSPFISQIGWCC
jgi:hypothetical protein